MKASRIVGVGGHLPSRVVTNTDLEKMMETSDEWIVQRTGIRERRWAAAGEGTSDLALKATEAALAHAGVAAGDLDMILFATTSPDYEAPGSGCFLQAKLGLSGIPAIDLRMQCAGFLYALSVADQYLRTGFCRRILVVGAETQSRYLDKTTRGRDMSVLFGDGAGAFVLEACDVKDSAKESHILSTHLHADGNHAKDLWMSASSSAGDSEERISIEMLEAGLQYPKMNGKKVFVSAVTKMPEVLREALAAHGKTVADVDLFLFHQANLRISDAIAESMGIPPEKIVTTIMKYGNTTSASIPLGMCEALQTGKLKKGMLVATVAFGSGFAWASALVRY